MFYSQFILAKKGPLGTIWIAAHLERKLRKNQVADTDIGVSVDSILFPDVPIALRLSSHLLLGVVRIYSRKVNYLFDDCSEALLKVKQAFRSTAVDLPPEESTAPYHSITLPETFDLDDFELPESDIFQGNYVDHHISTREQITLQDTMEGVVYSTSQFGLDERFGDGDTSQAGLDLEEELLLDESANTKHNEVSENNAQMSPIPHPETHANHERGLSEDMPLNGITDKIPDLDEDAGVVEYADAPCTPGLVEPNVYSVKEGLACDDHLESEDNTLREPMGKTDDVTGQPSFNHPEGAMELSLGEHANHATPVSVPVEDNNLSGELENNQADGGEFFSEAVTTKHIPADESVSTLVELAKSEGKGEAVSCNNNHTMSSVEQENDNVDIEVPHSKSNATTTTKSLELTSGQECMNVELEERQRLVNREVSNDHGLNNEQTVSTSSGFLRQCDSHISQLNGSSLVNESTVAPELKSVDVEPPSLNTDDREGGHVLESSTKVQGVECHVSDEIQSEDLRISEQTLNRKTLEDAGEQAKELVGLISEDIRSVDVNTSMTSELPAPEKLLSAPVSLLDEPHDMLIGTPLKEVQEEGGASEDGTNITGKKRSFDESALTVQSLNSDNLFGVARSRGTAESIPDDDDLLSSILVGRRSSVLKIKPTPPAPELPSKRARTSASRPSGLKRKVLMDGSMVLHGDTIRQQLTSTEDIRRQRKKAPCTNTEISMIQRLFLEEEIFNVPVLTGMSVELTHLHNEEAFDLSSIRVCENVDNIQASLELGDAENTVKKNVSEVGEIEGGVNVVASANGADEQPLQFPVQNGIQQDKDGSGSPDTNSQDNRNHNAVEMDFRSSVLDNLGEGVGNEGSRENLDGAAATDSTAMGVDPLQSELLPGEIPKLPTDILDQSPPTVDPMQMDTPNLLAATIDIQPNEGVPCMNDASDVGHEGIEAVDQSADRMVLDTAELEERKISASDVGVDGSAPNDHVNASLADVSALNDGSSNLNSINIDQNLENTENDKNRVCNDDMGLVVNSECINGKDQDPNNLCDDELKVGLESDVKDSSINHEETDPLHQANPEDGYDIQGAPFANDTGFLNVDDDEIDEDNDEGMPNTEDTRLLENTGWSSRTRAVARYLQTLFDKEAEKGRKGLSIDSLLAGKTRKEASRMFFETLVLKTRDYIQVEQPQAFGNINIKPRSRLMKSDF